MSPSPQRKNGMVWLYALALIPVFTELAESGHWPDSPREWLTEVVAGTIIAALVRKVRHEHLALLALARHDPLTGMLNRGAFDEAIVQECARSKRFGRPLTLVAIDLDRFKQLNDSAGHQAGDRVLKQFAEAAAKALRMQVDRSFRTGGDEFALLLPGSRADSAEAVLARILHLCEALGAPWSDGAIGVSAGAVEYASTEPTDDFVRRADEAMYRRKQALRIERQRA